MKRNSELSNFSIEDLEKEIIVRKKEQEEIPQPISIISWHDLRERCCEYIEMVSKDDVHEDQEHWIFEAAIEAVYGEGVWKWINERT